VHLEGLLQIEITRQASCDLATESTDTGKALQLDIIGH
jgi:hypothetical protein